MAANEIRLWCQTNTANLHGVEPEVRVRVGVRTRANLATRIKGGQASAIEIQSRLKTLTLNALQILGGARVTHILTLP